MAAKGGLFEQGDCVISRRYQGGEEGVESRAKVQVRSHKKRDWHAQSFRDTVRPGPESFPKVSCTSPARKWIKVDQEKKSLKLLTFTEKVTGYEERERGKGKREKGTHAQDIFKLAQFTPNIGEHKNGARRLEHPILYQKGSGVCLR